MNDKINTKWLGKVFLVASMAASPHLAQAKDAPNWTYQKTPLQQTTISNPALIHYVPRELFVEHIVALAKIHSPTPATAGMLESAQQDEIVAKRALNQKLLEIAAEPSYPCYQLVISDHPGKASLTPPKRMLTINHMRVNLTLITADVIGIHGTPKHRSYSDLNDLWISNEFDMAQKMAINNAQDVPNLTLYAHHMDSDTECHSVGIAPGLSL